MGTKTGTKVLFKPQPDGKLLNNPVLEGLSIKMRRFPG
jgi:hypothetical protein